MFYLTPYIVPGSQFVVVVVISRILHCPPGPQRRRRQTEEDLEYLEKRPKSVQRRKANPELRLADLLERIINTISATHEVLDV